MTSLLSGISFSSIALLFSTILSICDSCFSRLVTARRVCRVSSCLNSSTNAKAAFSASLCSFVLICLASSIIFWRGSLKSCPTSSVNRWVLLMFLSIVIICLDWCANSSCSASMVENKALRTIFFWLTKSAEIAKSSSSTWSLAASLCVWLLLLGIAGSSSTAGSTNRILLSSIRAKGLRFL